MQDLLIFLSNHFVLTVALVIVFTLVSIVELWRAKRQTHQLSPQQATHLINRENALIIDIRSNELYRQGHIIGAQILSADEVRQMTKKLEKYKSRPIILVCHTGNESQKITPLLIKNGYNAFSLSRGIRGWVDAQLPLIKE